jgi:hypothetical protein
MGTSVNQRSPDTPNWRIVQRAFENPDFPLERALREIWRAAGNQEQGDLAAQLAHPFIGSLAAVAAQVSTPSEAARAIGKLVVDQKTASLAADIARRAAMQAAGREGARELFVERLFMEATSYLVARDLPGHISPGRRLSSVAEARAFQSEAMQLSGAAVQRTTPLRGERDWSDFVTRVIGTLAGRTQ